MKKLLIIILAAFLASVICLLILEFLARILLKTAFEGKVDSTKIRSEFEEVYIPTFAQKENEEVRVFVYGGSSVWGYPVPEMGFVRQLDFQLNHIYKGQAIKIYNFGQVGFNSTRIRYSLERTIGEKPDLLVVYTGENEFIYPQFDFYDLVRATDTLKNRSDLAKLLLWSLGVGDEKVTDQAPDQKIPAYGKSRFYSNLKFLIFKNNMRKIAKMAKEKNVPLILATPASNIADWPPVERKMTNLKTTQKYIDDLQDTKNLIDQNDFNGARKIVDLYLAKDPDNSIFLYLSAKISEKKGMPNKDLYISAKDKGLVRFRPTTDNNHFTKSLADNKLIHLLDIEDIFSKNSPNGLVGFNLILDNVHPNIEGSYLIAKSITDIIFDKNLIPWLHPLKIRDLYLQDELFAQMNLGKEDDFNVFLKTAQYALKHPFINFEISNFYLEKAKQINTDDWQLAAIEADIAFLKGDSNRGQEMIEKARKLKGSDVKKEDVVETPFLGQFLSE